MSDFSIWVLVAGENDAVICLSHAGSSQLLRVIKKEGYSEGGDRARRAFAWRLMSELLKGARDKAYDGVIIMAAQDLLAEFRNLAAPEVKRHLIAEIARPPSEGYAIPVGFENYVADMPAMGGMQ